MCLNLGILETMAILQIIGTAPELVSVALQGIQRAGGPGVPLLLGDRGGAEQERST